MAEATYEKLGYVAGPYSHGNPILNVRKAIEVGNKIAAMGFAVFIPHLNFAWELVCPEHDYEFWLAQDMSILERSDFLYSIDGISPGRDREVKLCGERGIPVFCTMEKLAKWKFLLK